LSLIGFVGGHPPTPPEVSVPAGTPAGGPGGINDTGLFAAGNTLLDYGPSTTGELWLRNNDNTNAVSDVGEQTVRVVVSR
jgi:hypothetical protein